MRINLSKKNKIIAIALVVLVLGATGGYLLWRVNQEDTVAPTDSDASGCRYICDGSWTDQKCVHGSDGCNCAEKEVGSKAANGNLQCCSPYHSEGCENVTCGDGTCNGDETVASCPKDCAKCGDNICSSTESLTSCPKDCSVCGDNQCTGSETIESCVQDCSVCGDNQCTGSETASTCASDCVCKALSWSNKPRGTYTPSTVPNPVLVTNPNSSSTAATGIVIKLNSTTIPSCSGPSAGGISSESVGVSCYSISLSSGKQKLSINMIGGSSANMDLGTYTLSVSLPGAKSSCVETTSFVVASIVVPDEDPGEVPETGLLDEVSGKIYLGAGFVFLGIVTTQFSKVTYMFNNFAEKSAIVSEERKKKREEEKRIRFERRFK